MPPKELLAMLKRQQNDKITEYNKLTTDLNELRGQATVDLEREGELLTQRGAIKSEIDALAARADKVEAELKDDAAIERLQSQIGEVAERQAGDGVAREERVAVTEKRTYRKDLDAKGQGRQFMSDVARAFLGDWQATQRLDAHMREERTERPGIFDDERAAGTGAFSGFVVPQYLIDMNVGQASAKRPAADIFTHHDLPSTGMTVYLSKVTTGTSVDVQANQNDSISETDIDDTLIPITVITAAGSQTVARQAIERGLGVEEIVWADLQEKHGSKLDSTLLNAATNGLTNKATSVAYTDASPTAPELYPKILGAISASEGVFLNAAEIDYVLMHPRRWRWISAAMVSSWPFINSNRVPAQTGGSTEGVGYGKGVRGYLPDGTAVVTDANIATNLGTGTNEDEIYAVASKELHLWEDPKAPMFIRAEQTNAKKLGIDLVLYSYFAYYVDRYTGGHSKVAGTGLVTPTF